MAPGAVSGCADGFALRRHVTSCANVGVAMAIPLLAAAVRSTAALADALLSPEFDLTLAQLIA
jgi:hypothetical protein